MTPATFKIALPLIGFVALAACGRGGPEARDETMPTQAVARSAQAALNETPPNERSSETGAAPRPGPTSFDCKAAQSGVETMICGDVNLAAMDLEVARLYRLASNAPDDSLQRLHTVWLAKRNSCASAGDPITCLKATYAGRIHDLRSGYDDARAPGGISRGPQTWTCADGSEVFVTLIDTYEPMAQVSADQSAVLLTRAVSPSGQSYAGGGYELWLRDRTVSFTRPGAAATECNLSLS